jgi:hypothetical protein
MELGEFSRRYPYLWHATFPGGWDGIRRVGFLRPADLVKGCDAARRGDPSSVPGPSNVEVVLRDQLPSGRDPAPNLDGVPPAEWWRLINSRIYFFCHESGLKTLIKSYRKRGFAQDVIKVRTKALLLPVADAVEVTTVNSGEFPPRAEPCRGRDTFVALADFVSTDLARVKEVTVTSTIPVQDTAILSVVRHDLNGNTRRIWRTTGRIRIHAGSSARRMSVTRSWVTIRRERLPVADSCARWRHAALSSVGE